MDSSFKTQGFSQGIYKVSATKRELFGQLRILPDGRKFRYGKAGDTLVAGGACIMAECTAAHIGQVQTSGAANAVGATVVTVYVGAAAVTADMYKDGYLQIYDGVAGTTGFSYRISSHTTSAGSGTISCSLEEPLQVATVVGDTFSLIPNPWSSVIHTGTAEEHGFAGIAMKAASSGQYLWFQTGGPAICKVEGTPALGSELGLSDVAQEIKLAAAYTIPTIGFVYGVASADGKWNPVFLTTD